jgi:ATP synthase protein I
VPNPSLEKNSLTVGDHQKNESPVLGSVNPMEEYYQLQKSLLLWTIALTGIIFVPVWLMYSLKIALNYLVGACVGVVYLKLLARDVERLGQQQQRLGSKGLALVAGLIILAAKWQELDIIPVFLGFLTYKVTIIIYTVQSFIKPANVDR